MSLFTSGAASVIHLGMGIGAALLWWLAVARIMLVAARMYQIEEYEASRLWAWGQARAWNWHRALVVASVIALGFGAMTVKDDNTTWAAVGWLAVGLALHALWRWIPVKKALIWTPRMRRLGGAAGVLAAAIATGILLLVLGKGAVAAAIAVWLASFFVTSIALLLLILGNLLLTPWEARIRSGFVAQARRRIQEIAPVVVAVAGSWGKTSTKHILAGLLPEEAAALPTPKSFNTLMGVTRTINDDLEKSHRTFLVEMDAYGPGEIAAICRLVKPRITVITAVGAQHLERFASIDGIADSMYEAITALPDDGTAIIYAGDERCAALASRARAAGRRVVTYATEAEVAASGHSADVIAAAVSVSAAGSEFVWRWADQNLEVATQVSLLGAHQVLNVAAALVVVQLLGYDVHAAAARAATLPFVEHRLQPVASGNGITVIDDSYNANPIGVHNGLDVLSLLGSGQHILVTPGLVELGSEEAAENRRYGEHAARACQQVIVMRAKTSEALLAGLRDGGLDEDRIHVVDSLDEATAVIGKVARSGDAVLFANDLPDTYL